MQEMGWTKEDLQKMLKILPLGIYNFWDLVEIYTQDEIRHKPTMENTGQLAE